MHLAALAAGLVLALVTPVTSTAAYIDSNGAVSAETQMNGGGCYPASLTGPPTEQLNLLDHDDPAVRRRRRLRGARLPDVPPGRELRRYGLELPQRDPPSAGRGGAAARRGLLAGPPARRPAGHAHRRLDHARRRRGRRPLRRHPSGRLAPAGHDRVLPALAAARGRERERLRLRRPAAA